MPRKSITSTSAERGTYSASVFDCCKRDSFILEAKQGSVADRTAADKGKDDFGIFGQTAFGTRFKRGTPGWAKTVGFECAAPCTSVHRLHLAAIDAVVRAVDEGRMRTGKQCDQSAHFFRPAITLRRTDEQANRPRSMSRLTRIHVVRPAIGGSHCLQCALEHVGARAARTDRVDRYSAACKLD